MVFDERTLERFWSKVDRSGGPDECWPWLGGIKAKGYGGFDKWRSHRFALACTLGFMEGMHALHSCDNRICCNPKHLRWGTNSENCKEKFQRNLEYRRVHCEFLKSGTINRNPILNKSQVMEIRGLRKKGCSVVKCAAAYEVSKSVISAATLGYKPYNY